MSHLGKRIAVLLLLWAGQSAPPLAGRPVEPPTEALVPAFTVKLTSRLELKDHRGRLTADGKTLFVEWWSSTGKIRVLDAQTGKQVYAFEKEARGFELSPDGKLLTTLVSEFRSPDRPPRGQKTFTGEARYYSEMTVWDVTDPRAPRKLLLIPDAYRPVFSPDGKSLAVYNQKDSTPRRQWELWSLEKGKRLAAFEVKPDARSQPVFSPDGSLLALLGPSSLTLLATGSGEVVRALPHKGDLLPSSGDSNILLAHGIAGSQMAFSRDGKTVAVGGTDGTVKVWDVASGQLKDTLSGHSQPHTFVRFSPNGSRLLTGSIGLTRVLRVAPGLPGRGPPPRAWVEVIDPSKGEVILWNARALTQQHTLAIHCPVSLSWSRDGAILVVGDVSESQAQLPALQLWDVARGRRLGTWKGFEQGHFSGDGRTLLTSSVGRLVLWDVERAPQE